MGELRELMGRGLPTEHEMMVFKTMAKGAVSSGLYKGKEESIIMIMLAARELGIPPMQALNGGIFIIQGSVVISARMMGALIRKSGHSFEVVESTDKNCTLRGQRIDQSGDCIECSFSIEDARKAFLVKPGSSWEKYPKDMCFARAISRLARQLFSDIIGMGYVEGEIIDLPENQAPSVPDCSKIEEPKNVITDEMEKELEALLLEFPLIKKSSDEYMNKRGLTRLSEIEFNDFNRYLSIARTKKEKT